MEFIQIGKASLNVEAIAMVEVDKHPDNEPMVSVHFAGGGSRDFELSEECRGLLERFGLEAELEPPGA